MTTPPDFGGREIEEGLEEDLGARIEEEPARPRDVGGSDQWEDNEAHAAGKVCARCGAVIAPGQDARRRADGQWMHEICPNPPLQ